MIRLLLSHLFLTIILFIMGFSFFFLYTTSGLQLGIATAALFSPGKINIHKIQGSLFSSFLLEDINYVDASENIHIKSIAFSWSPKHLLHKHLDVYNLAIGETHIELLKNSTASAIDWNAANWLRYITLEKATLEKIVIEKNQKVYWQANSLQLNKNQYTTDFSAQMLNGEIQGTLSMRWAPHLDWKMELTANHINPYEQWRKKYADINLITDIYGNSDDITIKINQLNGYLNKQPLHGHAYISYHNKQFSFTKTELNIADAHINISGTVDDTWGIIWNISIPHLDTLIPNSKGSIISSGSILGNRLMPKITTNLDIQHAQIGKDKIEKLHGNIHFSLQAKTNSTASIQAKNIQISDYIISKVDLTASGNFTHQQHSYKAETQFMINNMPVIKAHLILPDFTTEEKSITGIVDLHVANLNFLSDYIPNITHSNGTLQGKILLNGLINKPNINAMFNVTQGEVLIPVLGITLKSINLQAATDIHHKLILSGNLQSGNGSAQVHGSVDLSTAEFPAVFTLQGNNLQIIKLDHYKIIASPDLKLDYSKTGLGLQGTVTIPQADITPTDFSDTVTMPDDVVYVGQSQKQTTHLLSHFDMQINLILSDNIFIQYQDLSTHLSGKLHITQLPNSPTTATGELYTIKGTYKAYGKTLDIIQGRLIYTGNTLMNPGLNIRAGREIKTIAFSGTSNFSNNTVQTPAYAGNQTVTVGVQILGTQENPQISLFSTPTMSQTDMLSYLLFGYPQSQGSNGSRIAALLNASSSLNTGIKTPSVSGITQGIQNKLGLSELTVGSTEVFDPTKGTAVATTSFIVGKQLAPKLYVHYSVGLFNPVSIVNLSYQLTKRWSILSQASTIDSGADLQYAFERN